MFRCTFSNIVFKLCFEGKRFYVRAKQHFSLLNNEYHVFSGGKERPGRDVDPSPLLVLWS